MLQLARRLPAASIAISCLILLAWLLVAACFGQPVFHVQDSELLLKAGAVDGATLAQGAIWRLLISQFLHVHFLHMLFNVALICIAGGVIERHFGRYVLVGVYLIAGVIGQCASVSFNPDLVSSGASQAAMGLCGFVAIVIGRTPINKGVALAMALLMLIQIGLDLNAWEVIKPGHLFGFVTGVLLALLLIRRRNALVSSGLLPDAGADEQSPMSH